MMEILNHLVESNFPVNFKLNKELYLCLSSETGRSWARKLRGRRITELKRMSKEAFVA
jgi:hypothetical protein